jgi:branched-chain amino acid transport system substrate-binding protein
VQLRPVPGAQRIEDIDERLDPARIIRMGEAFLYRSDVARVGVRARRFGKLDFVNGTFEIEFDVWFRHAGDLGVEQIVFTNAVEPITLGEPLDEVAADGLHYRLYRTEGIFGADALEAPYGGHVLSLSFHHVERTRDDLVLAVDTAGMNLGRSSTRAQRGAPARRLLGASTEWTVSDLFFFEDEVDEPALGHPAYLAAGAAARPFSQLTIGVGLRSQGVRSLLPAAWRRELLGVSLLGSLALLFVGRGSRSALRFVLQAFFALLLLLVAEPLLGNWWSASATPRQVAQLVRLFDVLWWGLPSLLVIVAIDRFVWQRAEARSGAQVPSLLRWFVVSIVLLVAFFGVVAFVYDYRLTGLLATSGVLAMVIGLAVQLNITNMFAGVAINLERPFRVGDWVMIHGRTPDPEASVIGQVVDINWRTTRLQTADDTVIVIPNGVISEKTITNFNQPGEMSRFALSFTVDQAVPAETVIPLIERAVADVIGAEKGGPLADPPPKVRIHEATPNGIEYIVRYRIRPREVSPLQARHTVNESVLHHLRAAGIEIAVPRRRMLPP